VLLQTLLKTGEEFGDEHGTVNRKVNADFVEETERKKVRKKKHVVDFVLSMQCLCFESSCLYLYLLLQGSSWFIFMDYHFFIINLIYLIYVHINRETKNENKNKILCKMKFIKF
jgi:hypothetical protein